jgi:hypothetical protein
MANRLTANTIRSCARFNKGLAKKYDDWMVAFQYKITTRKYAQNVLGRFNSSLEKRSISAVSRPR